MYEGCVAFSAGYGSEVQGWSTQSRGDGGVSEWWEKAGETRRGESFDINFHYLRSQMNPPCEGLRLSTNKSISDIVEDRHIVTMED